MLRVIFYVKDFKFSTFTVDTVQIRSIDLLRNLIDKFG